MYSKIWIPGTNKELDDLFDHLRKFQFENKSVPLWQNYSADSFKTCTALTITFDDNDEPDFCGSIRIRDCWPDHVYRICDRLWRHSEKKLHIKNSPGTGITAKNQIDWLKEHTNMKLVFVSRESEKWQRYVITQWKRQVNLDFDYDSHKYKTCSTPNDNSCWQYIIYSGDNTLLQNWEKK